MRSLVNEFWSELLQTHITPSPKGVRLSLVSDPNSLANLHNELDAALKMLIIQIEFKSLQIVA